MQKTWLQLHGRCRRRRRRLAALIEQFNYCIIWNWTGRVDEERVREQYFSPSDVVAIGNDLSRVNF